MTANLFANSDQRPRWHKNNGSVGTGHGVAPAQHGVAAFAPALILLSVSSVGMFLAAFSPTGAAGQYAVVGPPWYNLTQTIRLADAAGGDVVDVGALANVLIIHSNKPGIIWALYGAGAWLVIDPMRLHGCLGSIAPAEPAAGGS